VIVDTSALLSVMLHEEDRARYRDAILAAVRPAISAANWLEGAILLERRGDPTVAARYDPVCEALGLTIEPVTPSQAVLAREAYRAFGRGRHPAGLNFGDCFAYALAKERDETLLFKGEEFARTDVKQAL
jgi:ribonuclease VapC